MSNILWGTNDLLPSHYLLGNDSSHTLSGGGSTSLTMGTVATSPSAGFLSPSDSLIVTSPALSTSSLSSLDIVIVREQLDSERSFAATIPPPGIPIAIERAGADSSDFSFSDEDDEIIWRVSDSSDLEESHGAALSDSDDDDDFVVLRRTKSPGSEPEPLVKAEIAATSVRTIRGIPPNIPFGPDSILEDVGMDEQDWPTETPGVTPSELDTGPGVGSKPLNETGETKSPVNPVTAPPAKKKRKPKKKRTPEEVAKKKERKERKERKKREKKAAQAMKELQEADNEVVKKGKGNDSGRRKVRDTNATPATTKTVLQATKIVPSSSTVASPQHIPPSAAISNKETHRVPGGAVTGSTASSKKKQRKGKVVSPLLASGSLTCNPVVAEKVPEQVSGYNLTPESYDRAVSYITSFLSNPLARRDQVCHLALLQSLIIELGLLTDRRLLPQSIKSAKKFIRKHVFINVKEYLAKRLGGQHAVKELMYSSKSALVRDLKRKRNFASPAWVKERGLQDLLVSAFHRH